ncbi:MAG TPA: zinc-ribbon domain-containing protein [Pyrinomonadaceae bacterium]|nr:zinc-ribbon domain-containing protein [Pyrinomonadaceae bacterium]
MFCPKCGIKNPDDGKFCRSCGTDLGNVSDVLSGKLQIEKGCMNSKGKPISLESSLTKLFMGVAFLIVSIVLGFSGMGRGWWFWMLIPALMFIGGGLAQFIQVRSASKGTVQFSSYNQGSISGANVNATALPPQQTNFVAPESRYRTGDLVPPSVTDNTTRHLEMNGEGETMALPKK